MAKGDSFWRAQAQRDAVNKAEDSGRVADSLEVRKALMERVAKGEITLEAAQAEIAKIKRGAKKTGMVTRNQAFHGA